LPDALLNLAATPGRQPGPVEDLPMLRYALIFLIVAIVAGVLGFGGIAGAASQIAVLLFWVFVVLFVVGLFMHMAGGRSSSL